MRFLLPPIAAANETSGSLVDRIGEGLQFSGVFVAHPNREGRFQRDRFVRENLSRLLLSQEVFTALVPVTANHLCGLENPLPFHPLWFGGQIPVSLLEGPNGGCRRSWQGERGH